MKRLKERAKKIPFLAMLYRTVRQRFSRYLPRGKNTEQVFSEIYRDNKWGGKDSFSGPGSDVYQTKIIATELPVVFKDYGVSTVLDIPCGDFHWMKNVDLTDIDYIGADIVSDLIDKNSKQYGSDRIFFQKLDLIKNELPKVDLLFCRDCLVHLSFEDIICALHNICDSQSKYFLTTTFPGRTKNQDIVTGEWRTLNLEIAPFILPRPLKLINEGCTEGAGAYSDKALGLWSIADIQESLYSNSATRPTAKG